MYGRLFKSSLRLLCTKHGRVCAHIPRPVFGMSVSYVSVVFSCFFNLRPGLSPWWHALIAEGQARQEQVVHLCSMTSPGFDPLLLWTGGGCSIKALDQLLDWSDCVRYFQSLWIQAEQDSHIQAHSNFSHSCSCCCTCLCIYCRKFQSRKLADFSNYFHSAAWSSYNSSVNTMEACWFGQQLTSSRRFHGCQFLFIVLRTQAIRGTCRW